VGITRSAPRLRLFENDMCLTERADRRVCRLDSFFPVLRLHERTCCELYRASLHLKVLVFYLVNAG